MKKAGCPLQGIAHVTCHKNLESLKGYSESQSLMARIIMQMICLSTQPLPKKNKMEKQNQKQFQQLLSHVIQTTRQTTKTACPNGKY